MRNILFVICLFFVCVNNAHADDRIDDVYFSGKPINMIISTKTDSFVYFPNPVKVKDDFANHVELLVTNDAVIIKAKALFESKKMIFQDLVTEKIYVFIISSSNGESPRNVRLISPDKAEDNDGKVVKSTRSAYITLTQHASVSLYYPERYTPRTPGINSIKVKGDDASYFVSFNATAKPIRAWKGFGLFITAVKIKNLENKKIVLDPRHHFRGNWLFLTPQHSYLGKTNFDDITTVYVVSERPFWESLL